MRVLVTTAPLPSHLFLQVPLAWALRAQGHDVLVGVPAGFGDVVTGTGLPVVEYTPAVSLSDMIAFDRDGNPVAWTEDPVASARRSARGFARLSARTVDDAVALTGAWRPDLIVCDPCEFAGPMAAAVRGVPWVTYEWGVPLHPAFLPAAMDELAPERAHLDLTDVPRPGLVLDNRPPSLRAETGTGTCSMRFVPYNGCDAVPPWLAENTGRPRICLTLGSLAAGDSHLPLFREVLNGLTALDVEVVVAAADDMLRALGELPTRVRTVGWLPLQLVLPTCAAVVHHGGMGSLLTSLSYGVPQLVLPPAAYDLPYARRVSELSAGRWLDPYAVTAEKVRSSTEALLRDPRYRESARELAAEIAAQPAPAELVGRFEALVRGFRVPVD